MSGAALDTAPGMGAPGMDGEAGVLASASELIYREADLIDRGHSREWLELFAEHCVYWLPIDPSSDDPTTGLNILYDDHGRLADRVSRLTSGFSFTQEPASKVCHVISNLRLLDAAEAASAIGAFDLAEGDIAVGGHGVVAHSRMGVTQVLYARFGWILTRSVQGLRIGVKRVDLLNSADPLPVLTFLL